MCYYQSACLSFLKVRSLSFLNLFLFGNVKVMKMTKEDQLFISEHELFKNFVLSPSKQKCCSIISYRSDFLFIWNGAESSIHAINIKHCLRTKDLKSQIILKLSSPMLIDVDKLDLNSSSTFIYLSGKNGIAVIQIPDLFPQIDVATVGFISIGQRMFLGEQHTLRDVKWHPGSPSDSHIVVLTSDECLRCYDVINNTVLWKCVLSKHTPNIQSAIPNKISLGDTPVGFDFAPPPYDENLFEIKWPILVLWGHGDVYCVISTLGHEKVSMEGPLRMFPSSDDNYGTDASSLIVFGCSPPAVVISTCTGTLYHSLLMSAEEPEHKNDKSLYVIESVELDLGISVKDDDFMTSNISLMKDPIEASRYFCIHDGGIHLITLPLIAKLYNFITKPDEQEFSHYNHNSIVEYLICTGLINENKFEISPIMGCTYVDLWISLLILMPTGKLINVKLLPKTIHSIQPLAIPTLENPKVQQEKKFVYLVENALKETNIAPVQPLMKLPDANIETWLELTHRSSQHIKNVLKIHENVAGKMVEMVANFRATVSFQIERIEQLTNEKTRLQQQAEDIAERYEELNERQNSVLSKVENILKVSYYKQNHPLSQKERDAMDYLTGVQDKIKRYEKDLERVRQTSKYQKNIYKGIEDRLHHKQFYLDDARSRMLRKQLWSLHSDIGQLSKQVKGLKDTLQDLGGDKS